jgi:hypothetical protein
MKNISEMPVFGEMPPEILYGGVAVKSSIADFEMRNFFEVQVLWQKTLVRSQVA